MNKKLLVALSLIAGHAMAMELTIDDQQATPTEKKVVIIIQDQERELPARFIPLIGVLAGFYVEGTPLQMSPITMVSLATWKRIEEQLEQVYKMTKGDHQVRKEIIAAYSQLDNTSLIDLIYAIDLLTIPPLLEITLEIAQHNLTFDEIFGLPEYVCSGIIKRKALSLAGPVLVKEEALYQGHENYVKSIGVTPDGKIVSVSIDNTIRVWAMNGQKPAVCRGHKGLVCSVCFTPDNKIVSGSWDGTVRIWNMNGKQLAVCRGHNGAVRSACVTSDGKIVSGSDDKTVRIWDMNGQQLAVCSGHEGMIISVDVTPDGKIVSGSVDKTLRVWDINGKELVVCRGHEDAVRSMVVTPDGKIVSGSYDNTVRIWAIDGQELAVCRGHEDAVRSMMVTPDGKIVSGSADKTVRVWAMNGQELAVCRGHEDVVGSVRMAADGKIVSGSFDKTFRAWNISLLDRLSVMSKEQALTMGKILQSATCENQEQKEQCWKEIAKIFEEELVVELKKRKELENSENNPGKRLRLLEEEELVTENN